MIRYPLAMTQFSPEKCHEIQKPVINVILQKIGLNRNMRRSVIYGPLSLGGRELMDVRIEQITCQWELMRGHLCRNDRAGQGLTLTLNDHQCIIGSENLFLNKNHDVYSYGGKNTRWRYIWKSICDNGLKADFYDVWLPKKRGE